MFLNKDIFPLTFTLIAGMGEGKFQATAFDAALLDAGLEDVNLVEIGNILPPNSQSALSVIYLPGLFVPVSSISITRHRIDGVTSHGCLSPRISAAVAVGIPVDPSLSGVIGKFCDEGYADDCEETARQIVEEKMNNRKREIKEIKSISIEMEEIKTWGSVFAAVVFFK